MRDTAIGVVILSEAKNPPSLRPFVEFILSKAEADLWLNDSKARVQSGDYFFCLPQFVVLASKS